MARRERRGQAAAGLDSVRQTSRQNNFIAPRQNIRRRPLAWSAPRARQQTITQMNPFITFFHPEMEDQSLLSYEDDISYSLEESRRSPKRQKISRSKSALHSAPAAGEEQAPRSSSQSHASQAQSELVGEPFLVEEEGPKTPVTNRKIIPSSQSPADSPLSAQSRRASQAARRTPLQDRSANFTPRRSFQLKTPGLTRREIADSMSDAENENSESTMPLPRFKDLIAEQSTPSRAGVIKHGRTIPNLRGSGLVEEPVKDRDMAVEEMDHSRGPKELSASEEILESYNEEANMEDADFDAGMDTQAAIEILSSEMDVPSDDDDSAAAFKDEEEDAASDLFCTQPLKCEDARMPGTDLLPPTENRSLSAVVPNSSSSQTQKQNELHPPLPQPEKLEIETESQYEGGWHTYHPQASMSPTPSSAPLSQQPLHEETPATSTAMTVPTQPSSFKSTSNKIPQPGSPKFTVSPSQATTVDTTQASQNQSQRYHGGNSLGSNSARYKLARQISALIPSSPPPMEELDDDDPDLAKYAWTGVPLHDGQLLPEGLMMDDDLDDIPTDFGLEGLRDKEASSS